MASGIQEPDQIYQIKVTLADSQPPIWRRIQVKSDITLAKLHRVLQMVMGWTDMHLHQFAILEKRYGVPDEEDVGPTETKDEGKYKLHDLVRGEDSRFSYDYDFGDNWEHELLIEKVLPDEKGVRYPLCLDGARACPPEDVGGTLGYKHFLEVIRNPTHPEHKEFLDWISSEFDPEEFDVDEVNHILRSVK